jgi:hypothetical protein
MLEAIAGQLVRLQATEIRIEPLPDSRIRVQLGEQFCALEAEGFLALLKSLPDGVGHEAVRDAIHESAIHGESWASV